MLTNFISNASRELQCPVLDAATRRRRRAEIEPPAIIRNFKLAEPDEQQLEVFERAREIFYRARQRFHARPVSIL